LRDGLRLLRRQDAVSNMSDLSIKTIFLMIFAVVSFLPECVAAQQKPSPVRPESVERDGQRDFDWQTGKWKVNLRRRLHPLTGSTEWVEYEGTSTVRPVLGGRGSLLELELSGPAGRIEGLGLRLYNPSTRQWSLNWANGSDGAMSTPMTGEFKNGVGEFFDQETYNGRAIYVKNGFFDVSADFARFEQAFSDDGGKSWEINWIMTFKRIKG